MGTRYVALLRGINVGGNNIIPMAKLKSCFEAGGFDDVSTYIASGNVLFGCADKADAKLIARIEAMLENSFNYRAKIVLRSEQQLRDTIAKAPRGFGSDKDAYRYDVLFVKEPTTPAAVLKAAPLEDGVDAAWTGPGAVYWSRLETRASQSKLSKLASMPVYKSVTARNWNTTTALLGLFDTPLRKPRRRSDAGAQ